MKITTVMLGAVVGAMLVGGGVYQLTPRGGFEVAREPTTGEPSIEGLALGSATDASAGGPSSDFSVGETVEVSARVAHPKLGADSSESTFVLVEVRGSSSARGGVAPANLSLVIDKSGSMKGTRVINAIHAAEAAVDRLQDGDGVSVTAFDTRVETIVPHTRVDASSRESIKAAIRRIQLGGDTCMSCGLEAGLAELRRASPSGTTDAVQRMIVLSDGQANHGVTDLPGFRSLAARAQSQAVSITTIGVDVEYDEKALSAVALASNGRHYFVENDAALARVFEAETAALTQSVASGAVAEIELAPDVELVQVFDRGFQRNGSRLTVPLGAIGKSETKTVLVELRLPAGAPGARGVAKVDVSYRDLVSERAAKVGGELAVLRVPRGEPASDTDALVLDRLQRSRTAGALKEANTLFSVGKSGEAKKTLEQAKQSLVESQSRAKGRAPAGRARDVDDSFAMQEAELSRAANGFAEPPPATPAAGAPKPVSAPSRDDKSNVKRNAQVATDLAF
jgi:Ca-activated chloride channel homolog